MIVLTEEEALQKLREAISRHGRPTHFGKAHGVSDAVLSYTLSRRNPIGDKIGRALGLKRMWVLDDGEKNG